MLNESGQPGPQVERASPRADRRCAEHVLEVAERLFAERGFDSVTVRDIAEAAAVTHPLIYYYWGSKQGLLAAVLEKHQTRMRRLGSSGTEARAIVESMVRENLAGSRLYLLTMARAFLNGMPTEDWPGGFPGVEGAIQALLEARPSGDPQGDRDVREVVMAFVAMLIGWVLLEDELLAAAGLRDADRDEARESMIRSMHRILDQVLPPDPDA